ncbi:DUF1534 domain-containing protein [Pseudomonas syringae]|nr:DUF1534 domain-containing protein [Pseudomonas syringae]UZA78554.1 DUF1534 domain-containing protein [Pseudomonas syringae]
MPCGDRFGEIRWCSCARLSFRTLQRGNAVRDAPRHGFTTPRTFRRGRRASRTAYPRVGTMIFCGLDSAGLLQMLRLHRVA